MGWLGMPILTLTIVFVLAANGTLPGYFQVLFVALACTWCYPYCDVRTLSKKMVAAMVAGDVILIGSLVLWWGGVISGVVILPVVIGLLVSGWLVTQQWAPETQRVLG